MKAMLLTQLVSMESHPEPLTLIDIPIPEPADNEVLIQVSACGVCHTELDEIEGRTPPPRLPIVPGHQVIGRIVEIGKKVTKLRVGNRVGVGWIYRSSGADNENLSDQFVATGRDVNGGYAEFMAAHESYAYEIPESYSDYEAAPLLCAGSVGFRALKLTRLQNGKRLGLTGFGGSGHLVLKMAKYLYPQSPIYVFARNVDEQKFAIELGADWSGDTSETPPASLDAIIDTTPVWLPVVAAMKNLRPGGRLLINAIRKEDLDKAVLSSIDFNEHLWYEKSLQTVANVTRRDIVEFLAIAEKAEIRPQVEVFPLSDANKALRELRSGKIRGSKVLVTGIGNVPVDR
jgi:propanol-preferring alcohol dehydrogenase